MWVDFLENVESTSTEEETCRALKEMLKAYDLLLCLPPREGKRDCTAVFDMEPRRHDQVDSMEDAEW